MFPNGKSLLTTKHVIKKKLSYESLDDTKKDIVAFSHKVMTKFDSLSNGLRCVVNTIRFELIH